jgi:hypothetical protein
MARIDDLERELIAVKYWLCFLFTTMHPKLNSQQVLTLVSWLKNQGAEPYPALRQDEFDQLHAPQRSAIVSVGLEIVGYIERIERLAAERAVTTGKHSSTKSGGHRKRGRKHH